MWPTKSIKGGANKLSLWDLPKQNPWGASLSDGYFYMRISETFGQGIPSSVPEINDPQKSLSPNMGVETQG